MFSGMSINSIDSRGRVVLPAKFREELGESFYVARGFKGGCVQVMSAQTFGEISEAIMSLPADKAMALQYVFTATAENILQRHRLEYVFTATAVEVTPNAQGRVSIPQALREYADLGSEALVIGMNNRVEIWSKPRFDSFLAANQGIIDEALGLLRL